MLVARDEHLHASDVDVGSGRGRTQEADGVERHLKLRTGAHERAAHWLHLPGGGGGGGGDSCSGKE